MSHLPINWDLIKNPLNWLTVILMLAFAGFALHLLLPNQFPQGSSGNAQNVKG
jgi:hypothetical protein